MYDFLDPKFSPKVKTSSAAFDGFEVTNLISDDSRTRARGFMAFTSITPPVDIHFEFICDIAIRYIILQTTVGSHKTIGIEILAGEHLVSLGKQTYETAPGLIYCDSKFYNKQKPPTTNTDSYHIAYFKSFQHRVFTSTNKLCVRIIRTDSRSVPCLGDVQVWGYIAKNCSKETKHTVHRIINSKSENIEGTTSLKTPESILAKKNCDFSIPEDFKDALTYEVMALPMTLPSGNTIDQSTLDKCISNDAMYGRKAVDPFTGLEFLPSRKPVLNVPLKSRIDSFLLEHGNQEETKCIARTLGTSTQALKTPQLKNKIDEILPKRRKVEVESTSDTNLDDAIANVVNSAGFMCFTKNTTQNTTGSMQKMCARCKGKLNLYEITRCGHLFCRPCLYSMCNCCGGCKLRFVSSDIVKVK